MIDPAKLALVAAIAATAAVMACLAPELEGGGEFLIVLDECYGACFVPEDEPPIDPCSTSRIDGVTIEFGDDSYVEACSRVRHAQSLLSLCANRVGSELDIWAYGDGRITSLASQGLDPVIDSCIRETLLQLEFPIYEAFTLSLHIEIEPAWVHMYSWEDNWSYRWDTRHHPHPSSFL